MHISLSPSHSYRLKCTAKDISPYLTKGFRYYEDRHFYLHPGINPIAVIRAIHLNLGSGEIRSGASTISMQVARMIEKRPRTLGSKCIELFRTLQLEWHYSKKDLLLLYLNMIPMGGNIRGVGAASYFYFGKAPSEISLNEAALLIGIPNSPEKFRPDRFPDRCLQQQKKVLERIAPGMRLKKDELNFQRSLPLELRKLSNPYKCPHLIEAEKPTRSPYMRRYSIDLTVQKICEESLARISQQNAKEGIFNAAIMVIRNTDRQVLAYVGSPDYFDEYHGGQINACRILRSPGSTLKPFLYARGFEAGLITPYSILYDIPKAFGKYDPANFSKKTLGLVTTRKSLLFSLNIPAVRLENELGERNLTRFIQSLPLGKRLNQVKDSGLTVVLGGYPLTLEQLSELYVSLANGGMYAPLNYFTDSAPAGERRILSPESCYMVTDILSDYERPDLPFNWAFTTYLAKVALKTGTSFGLRDAWCFAYNPEYTVAVWFGNVDSTDSGTLLGIKKAAPVAIRIFNQLTRNSDTWFTQPETLGKRKICPVSGQLPGTFCTNLIEDFFIPGKTLLPTCRIHREFFVNAENTESRCSACLTADTTGYKRKILEVWPPEVVRFFKERGMRYDRIPHHHEECPIYRLQDNPKIIYPPNNAEFLITKKMKKEDQKIMLKAQAAQDANTCHWFLNKELVADSPPDGTVFLIPRIGDWTLTVTDPQGRSDSVKIRIREE